LNNTHIRAERKRWWFDTDKKMWENDCKLPLWWRFSAQGAS